jgi:hypothetical protein
LRAINAHGEEKTKEYIDDKLVAIVEEAGQKKCGPNHNRQCCKLQRCRFNYPIEI